MLHIIYIQIFIHISVNIITKSYMLIKYIYE